MISPFYHHMNPAISEYDKFLGIKKVYQTANRLSCINVQHNILLNWEKNHLMLMKYLRWFLLNFCEYFFHVLLNGICKSTKYYVFIISFTNRNEHIDLKYANCIFFSLVPKLCTLSMILEVCVEAKSNIAI